MTSFPSITMGERGLTENADSHDFLRTAMTSAMTSFGKVINMHRDDYAITAIAVRFAGSIKELETI